MPLVLNRLFEAQSFVETGECGWHPASVSLSGKKSCANPLPLADAGLSATNLLPSKRGDSRRSQLNCHCDSAAVVVTLPQPSFQVLQVQYTAVDEPLHRSQSLEGR